MKRVFSVDGKVYQTLAIVAELVELNVAFLIAVLPIVTAGAAFTALYTVVNQLHGKDLVKPWPAFWRAFRINWRKGTEAWLIILGVILLVAGGYVLIGSISRSAELIMIPLTILCALIMLSMMYVFPLLARYENSIRQTFANSLVLALQNMIDSILVFLLGFIVCVYLPIFYWQFLFAWLLTAFSGTGYLQMILFRRVFARYEQPVQE